MRRISARRPNLFLMELIAAILFFALCSAVCIQIFAGSRQKAAETADLNQAVALAQSMADVIRTGDAAPSDQTLYFDQDWQSCENADTAYQLTVSWSWKDLSGETSRPFPLAGSTGTAEIAVRTAEGNDLFRLEVRRHFPHTLAEQEVAP